MGFYRGPRIITDSLVMYLDAANPKSYPGTGVVWNDLSKNGNNGTLTNGPTFDSGNGGSIVFDGVNDYVDLSTPNSLTLHSGGTISIWFKWNSYNGSSWSNTLIGKGVGGWTAHHYILFKHESTNKLHFSVSDGTSFLASSGPQSTFNIELNTWYNVVITIDNPLKKMYINGEFNTQVSSSIMPINSTAAVSLGRTGTSVYYLDGVISNVMIYNRILTSEEVLQNYNATKSRFGL